jgi:hypothetical protein
LAEIGEPAVPTLLAMIEERDESEDYRSGAAHALIQIRSANTVPVSGGTDAGTASRIRQAPDRR